MAQFGRLGRRLLTLAVVLAAFVSLAPARPAVAAPATQEPQSYVLVDADSGHVLAAKNEHQAFLTASTAKLLTAVTALERLPLSATVPVSDRAAKQPAMKINMHTGEVWKLTDALSSLLIVSANDAAFAIAERAGGTVEQFAKYANAEAKRLGATDTTFADPAGLDNNDTDAGPTHMSAYDLAVVARNALAVPTIANAVKTLDYDFTDPTGAGRHLRNHNDGFLTTYPGATGMKTGFTKAASRTLVTSATRNGRTMIAVVMGTWDDTGWAGFLLDQGFGTPANAPGTGAAVPPVRAVTADARLTAFKGLPNALGLGAQGDADDAATTGSASPATTPTSAPATSTETKKSTETKRKTTPTSVAKPTTEQTANVASATTASTSSDSSGSSFLNLRTIAIVFVVALVLLFVLRRRAVRRQRARRLARQQRMAEIRRRRMIDVVEAPVEETSHVRVVPAEEPRSRAL